MSNRSPSDRIFDTVSRKARIAKGACRWALFCGLGLVVALGSFSVSAVAQVTDNLHLEGPYATEFSSGSTSTSYTSTYINTGRDIRKSISGAMMKTTYVDYQVCVTTLSTNTTVCEVGSGTIANSELTGDVITGQGTPPKNLSLNFNSATEPGYTVIDTECDNGGCFPITPAGGPIAVNWRKNGLNSRTILGTEEDRYGTTLMTRSNGESATFSADSWGAIVGTPITGVTSSYVGFARSLNLEVVIGPK